MSMIALIATDIAVLLTKWAFREREARQRPGTRMPQRVARHYRSTTAKSVPASHVARDMMAAALPVAGLMNVPG
jgi:hypothetical protein